MDRELTFEAAIASLSAFVQQKMRLIKEREMPVIDPRSTAGANRDRERIWFSPGCLRPADSLLTLMGTA